MTRSRIRAELRWAMTALAVALGVVSAASCSQAPDEEPVGKIESAATVPTGFIDEVVASGLASPTAMAFAPDGRIFVAQQGGALRVIQNGTLLATPFATVTTTTAGERGLLGVTFDPAFTTNGFVYVYYTVPSPLHNRVSRFTANGNVAAGGQTILLELEPLLATNHNGGAMHFGPDGKLYIAVGENARGDLAQRFDTRLGKILRVNADGSIPTDNPFFNDPRATGVNRAIWALGLRNPFTFAFQRTTGRMFINDVGQNAWEEINDGIARSNYGWPTVEGNVANPNFRTPLFVYNHEVGTPTGGCAITGGAFYNPTTVQFPAENVGQYFFADFCSNWIRRYNPATNTVSGFATAASAPVDIRVQNDGALYYLQRGTGSNTGQVRRVRFASQTQAPTITTHPASRTVAAGQQVTFTVNASGSAPLSFQWQRGTTNIAGATSAALSFVAAAQDNGATFRAVVTNSAGSATSNSATLTVTAAGTAPVANIVTPAVDTTYRAGTTVNYSGTGSDQQDGTLPGSAFTWEVLFHHDTHNHPHLAPTTGATSGSFAIPNRGETAINVWYRIHLTVRDSSGLTHSVFRDVNPQLATMTLQTNPTGLQVLLDGSARPAPSSFQSVIGMIRSIGTTSPQTLNGSTFNFTSWSDGGALTHEITTPATNTTFLANFGSSTAGPIADGIYRIVAAHSNKCIAVAGNSSIEDADVTQLTCPTSGTTMRWSFRHLGGGIYEVVAVHSNRCLNVTGNSAADNADVRQLTCNGATGQRWLARAATGGGFNFLAQTGTNRCLDVSGVSTADNANIIQWNCNNGANQRFSVVAAP